MLSNSRYRWVGALLATSTLLAMMTAMVLAAPSGAASGERESATSFKAPCVIAPGVLNIQAQPTIELSFKGPEEVTEHQSGIEFTEASVGVKFPPEIREEFAPVGAVKTIATLTNLIVDAKNMEPKELNISRPKEPIPYPEGIPFEFNSEKEPITLRFPKEGTFSFGPYTVTGKAGEEATLSLDGRAGFEAESEGGGFKATGNGIVASIVSYNASGEKEIGPLTMVCTAPSNVLTEIPISRAVPTTEEVEYANSALTGSITDKALGQAITLPPGSVFNGTGERSLQTGLGSIHGSVSIPPFEAPFKLFGVIPATLGLRLTGAEPVAGTVGPSEGPSSHETVSLPMKLNLGVTSFKLLGLSVPTRCTASEPVSLALLQTLGGSEALAQPLSFSGSTAISRISCSGGILGSLFGSVLSGLISGGGNPYAIQIAAPKIL